MDEIATGSWVHWQQVWDLAWSPGVLLVLASAVVVGGVVLATPPARARLARITGTGRGPLTPPPGTGRRSQESRLLSRRPSTLTDAELCRAWRHSFTLLRGAGTAGERSRLAALRQDYLDELERRNPEALQAWFASGARAASGLERFVAPRRFLPPG